MTDKLLDRLRIDAATDRFSLDAIDPTTTPGVESKSDAKDQLEALRDELFDLHELMYATEERRALIVLQGTDASGKNGTMKHVFDALNPAYVTTASFQEPTEEEAQHHFLWRVRNALPEAGQLTVFDRSHYEDLVVPIATADDAVDIDERIEEIEEFERELVDDGTLVLKFLLHISYDEQRRRFLRRLRRDDKRWKFSEADLETRGLWDEYQAAYGQILPRTSFDEIPWHVVPADNKWYRNWAIATMTKEALTGLNLSYPQPDLDIAAIRERLAPPG